MEFPGNAWELFVGALRLNLCASTKATLWGLLHELHASGSSPPAAQAVPIADALESLAREGRETGDPRELFAIDRCRDLMRDIAMHGKPPQTTEHRQGEVPAVPHHREPERRASAGAGGSEEEKDARFARPAESRGAPNANEPSTASASPPLEDNDSGSVAGESGGHQDATTEQAADFDRHSHDEQQAQAFLQYM